MRTLDFARPIVGRLAITTLLGAGAVAAAIGLMGTSAWLISRASEHPNEQQLAVAVVAVQFFGLSRGFFRYGERLVGHDAAFRALALIRVRIYRQLERLAPAGLPAFRSGDLLTRLVADVDSLQDLIVRVIPPVGVALLVGAATVAFMWLMLPAGGLIVLIALLVSGIGVPWLTALLSHRRVRRQATARGELSAALVDLMEGAPELIAYGAASEQLQRVSQSDRELTAIAKRSAGTNGIGLSLTTLFAGLAAWGSLFVAVPAVHTGRLNGVLLAVIALVPLAAFEIVVGLPAATQSLEQVRRSSARIFAVTDAPTPVTDPLEPLTLPAGPYTLELDDVSARYPGTEQPAIQGVDLRFGPGQRIAIVGPSGAGKSTLAEAAMCFLSHSGSLTINGIDYNRLAGDDIRKIIALVGQRPYMFDTTLRNNLLVAKPDATDEELARILERVGLGSWLADLPGGLGTGVGHHGTQVSGGEQQRIAVARALMADRPVLILDEPVEHLDPCAAESLSSELLALTADRSVILITHRLTGLETVDEILVMNEGRVVERGSHDHLLSLRGWYFDLWLEQLEQGSYAMQNDDARVFQDPSVAASVHMLDRRAS